MSVWTLNLPPEQDYRWQVDGWTKYRLLLSCFVLSAEVFDYNVCKWLPHSFKEHVHRESTEYIKNMIIGYCIITDKPNST